MSNLYTFCMLLFFLLFSSVGTFAQDSTEVNEPDPLLGREELKNSEWFYSLEEALKQPAKVYKLSLADMGLKEVPPEIKKFKNLQLLNLNQNRLKTLPPEIGELKNLQMLSLYGNRIKTLPPEMAELKNLSVLYLGNNRLVEIPIWVGGLGKLDRLDVSLNRVTKYEIDLVQFKLPNCEVTY